MPRQQMLCWSSLWDNAPSVAQLRASRDADVVLLGVGHHFPRALMLAEKWTTWGGATVAKRARVGFFARSARARTHARRAAG